MLSLCKLVIQTMDGNGSNFEDHHHLHCHLFLVVEMLDGGSSQLRMSPYLGSGLTGSILPLSHTYTWNMTGVFGRQEYHSWARCHSFFVSGWRNFMNQLSFDLLVEQVSASKWWDYDLEKTREYNQIAPRIHINSVRTTNTTHRLWRPKNLIDQAKSSLQPGTHKYPPILDFN